MGILVLANSLSTEPSVDIGQYRRSLPHHGRQITESESEAKDTAKSESQQRDSKEDRGLSSKGGAEEEVEAAAQEEVLLRPALQAAPCLKKSTFACSRQSHWWGAIATHVLKEVACQR
ncbi:MAG: hypothetical protein H0X34_13760 [Chthoniobacterales bacterium]|jgi:hypothetical protein|nr:hypothetical protein [Chthoniobacterales bacterium]